MTATPGLAGFLTRVRGTLAGDARPDAEVVREYVTSRSEAAFAELVRRFAPMVWGVCRRTVGHHQHAEDAFQAVFVVLVRRANAIRPPAAVGGWLHAVAVHTSLRARTMADRRRKRHTTLDAGHEPAAVSPPEPADPDAVRALDEEVARLPDKLRAAVALCELDGVSRKDAAARLGVAEGTLSSRLAAARKQLAARLRSRGVTLGAGGIATPMSGTAGAVPPVATSASDAVSALAEGAIRTMFLSKLKLLSVGSLAGLLVVLGGLLAVAPAATTDQRQVRRNAPIPKAEKEGVILVGVQEDNTCRIELRTPTGEKVATIPLGDTAMGHPALSRDGKRVAVWSQDSLKLGRPNRAEDDMLNGTLRVYDVEKPDEPLAKFGHKLSGRVVFAPDGQSLFALEQSDYAQQNKPSPEFTVYRFDLKTSKKEKLDLPAGHRLADVSPDGKALLTTTFATTDGQIQATTHRVPLDTLKPEPLSKSSIRAERFSRDGKRFVGLKYVDPKNGWKQELTLVDVKDGTEAAVKLEDDTEGIWNAAWSPDGKKVLVHRKVLLPGAKPSVPVGGQGGGVRTVPENKPEVAIRNLDGSDPKVLLELKREVHVFGIDWR